MTQRPCHANPVNGGEHEPVKALGERAPYEVMRFDPPLPIAMSVRALHICKHCHLVYAEIP
jgi:hypothetical protein